MSATLLLKQRHALIQQQLQADGRVLALDLARQLDVSEDTIRRDLREMAAAGLCQRVYGGALPLAPDGGSLTQRKHEVARKQGAPGAGGRVARARGPGAVSRRGIDQPGDRQRACRRWRLL